MQVLVVVGFEDAVAVDVAEGVEEFEAITDQCMGLEDRAVGR